MSFDPQWPPAAQYAAFGGSGAPGQPMGPAGPGSQQAGGAGAAAGGEAGESAQLQPPAAIPPVDIVESADELVVHLDAAGFDKDQIEIHADANNLYVTADRSQESVFDPERGERALLNERPVRLERTIPLPAHIDPEQATASHEDGVCRIVVQKDEDDRRHEVGFQ